MYNRNNQTKYTLHSIRLHKLTHTYTNFKAYTYKLNYKFVNMYNIV